ncbi:MAG: nuclear transport factor 2 family protein [Acidobacteriaceae bacterium]
MRTQSFAFVAAAVLLTPLATLAQTTQPISPSARAGIDAGNQAWIDGVKAGNVAPIIATYSEEAVDCGPTGNCIQGRLRIEQHMKTQMAKTGLARSASVSSWGSTQHGNFVYEWGQAEATFNGGNKIIDQYLTVWQKQSDGTWKIFRNLVIPKN